MQSHGVDSLGRFEALCSDCHISVLRDMKHALYDFVIVLGSVERASVVLEIRVIQNLSYLMDESHLLLH